MLFEELGFRYIGPIDGHDLRQLRKYLEMVKDVDGPGPAARPDRQGARLPAGRGGPGELPHAAAVHMRSRGRILPLKNSSSRKAYTDAVSAGDSRSRWQRNPKVTVMTAAMCQGNKLEKVRDAFPDRFFDVGICESHAVAFAAGQAKAGLAADRRHLQHVPAACFDQIFQEVALQNLPVSSCSTAPA